MFELVCANFEEGARVFWGKALRSVSAPYGGRK